MKLLVFIMAVIEEDEKFCAITIPVQFGQDIKPILDRYGKAIMLHLYENRQQSDDMVIKLNDTYKEIGKYYPYY